MLILNRTAGYVITAISGGLGNQMFQYAAGRRLALVNSAELLLYPGDRYRRGSYRAYRLDCFGIGGRLATEAEAGGLRRVSRTRRRLAKPFPCLAPREDREVVRETSHLFDPAILSLQGNVKLRGYWQCERYFADIADTIRADFRLRQALSARDREVLARIQSGPCAFIHVRRGDYVTHPVDKIKFGTCSPEYYRGAVALLRQQVGPELLFFVFSDDASWVREMRIGGEGAQIVDWNGDSPQRDLALMRECTHAVIANSSFSWWGAWLGDGRERMVIAPRVWFQGRPNDHDIVPERWLKLG